MSNPTLCVPARPAGAVKTWPVVLLAPTCFALLALSGTAWSQTVNTNPRPQLVPNGRKYQERGLQPATGRSGSATATARALLGKDGATTVEVSTGGLDGGGERPGNINKTRLKP